MGDLVVTREMLAAKFGSIFPHLDERQRRLLLGAEARALGHGGIRLVAAAAGVREGTVSLGARELESGQEPLGRARRPGGGRKPLPETDPGLVPALLALVGPEERGDPESPLRWTVKSTRALAGELTRQGHPVSADTVHKLLKGQGFSLQANARTIEGRQHPDRDGQFRYINEQARAHLASGDPVISVDAKKKEQVGQYASPGRGWRPAGNPVKVADHDFPGPGQGKVTPYGIYDLAADAGWVSVGTDRDTAAFAVESIRRWWNARGSADYPAARRLLITADAGGSNGYRTRAWKTGLADLARETGLEITCCHFPPGTSKWNKIEHRLFSRITMNWRSRPLASHDIIVNSIAATATRTGLRVHAELDDGSYPAGIKVSDAQMDACEPAVARLLARRMELHPDPRPARGCRARSPARPPHPRRIWPGSPTPRITGMTGPALDALTALDRPPRRRAARGRPAPPPRLPPPPPAPPAPAAGPRITLAGKLLAAILRDRHGLPCKAIAALLGIRPRASSAATPATSAASCTRPDTTSSPPPASSRTLDDLCRHAAAAGITIPAKIKPAC